MGILDSLFGSDETTVKNEVSWPTHFDPLARDVAGLTRNVFERPQHVWTGQRSAGPSAMRLASFGKAAEIGGGQGLGMGDRMGALMDVAGNQGNINTAMSGLTPEEIEKRMNPYTQGWIQKTLDSSDRGNDRARARRAARRAGTPGSRGMLAETFADTEYGRNRDLLTAGMQKGAYERSEDVLERERERLGRFDIQNRSLAGTLSSTASRLENEELERNMRQMGALRAAGAEQEAFQNQQIQDNMDLFREVRDYPENRLSLGTGVLAGVPTGSTQTKDTGRNIFSQVLGAGATVAGLGLPGGGTIGGSVFKSLGFRRGGRIGLQGGGGVPSPEMVMSLVEEFQSSGQPLPPELMMAAQEMGVLPPMPLPQGGNPPQAPSVPLPRPRAVAPGALAQAATDIDAMPPTTSGVPGRQMDQGMGRGALAMAAPVAAPTPSAPQQDQSVMGALGKYFGEVNPSTGRSQLFEIGTRLMAAGAPNAQGIDRGLFGNMGLALRGAEDSREKAIKARQAARLAGAKVQSERELAVATLRAKYGGPQSSEGKLFQDWQGAVRQFGSDSDEARTLEQILIEKGSDPEKLSNVSRMMAELDKLDPEDPGYAEKRNTLRKALDKASTKAPKGEKLRSMNVITPDGQTYTVMTDADGNDYVNMNGKRTLVSQLPPGTETFTPVSPTKASEAKAQGARLKAMRGTISDVRKKVANLSDDQLGLSGQLRTTGSEFAGMIGDLAGLFGYKTGQDYMNDLAQASGGGENLKVVPVLENTLFELMMAHKKAVTGTTRILAAQQALIKDQVSLQGIKSAAGIRARVEEVLAKIEDGTYDQEIEASLRGGGDPSVADKVSAADKIVGLQ